MGINDNSFCVERVLESEEFPYAVGALQARVVGIPKGAYRITEQDKFVAEKVKGVLEKALKEPVYFGSVIYKGELMKIKRRVIVWNKALMDFLRGETRNNTKVASFVRNSVEQRRNFIRGFLDSRSSVSYSSWRRNDLDYVVRSPRIVVTKSFSEELLISFANLLREESLDPVVNYNAICFYRQKDMRNILRKRLITAPMKFNALNEIYSELAEYQRIA